MKFVTKKRNKKGVIVILGGLGVQMLFVVLKLAEVIDWSWGWVLFPAWGGLIVLVALVLFTNILNRD